MELFLALLIGLSFWLLLFRWGRSRRARAIEAAGPLLLEFKATTRAVRWWRSSLIVGGISLAIMAIACVCLLLRLQHSAETSSSPISAIILDDYGFSLHLIIAVYLAMSLGSLVPPTWKYPKTEELREYGILHGPSSLRFTPWSKVAECHWISPKTLLGVSLCWWIPKFFKRGRITINENEIAPGQKEAITAVLGRFAAVYDCDGVLLAKPETTNAAAPATFSRQSRFRFLFDLPSLLLFFVFAGCIASLYGIRYWRVQPQHEAMARLAKFAPASDSLAGVPWNLDFSKCVRKPTDADLADVAMLSRLDWLDLTGAPITDAGLKHLKGLKRLRSIMLIDTAVTEEGAKRLHEALPNAHIFYGPTAGKKYIKPDKEP